MENKLLIVKNPFSVVQNEMLPNVLIMCKLLFLLLLTHDFFNMLNDPFIPFIKSLDYFNHFSGILKIILRCIFVLSGIMLLFNVRVRQSCIALGFVIIIGLISSKPVFRNHLFIGGCIFLLSGLTNNVKAPKLIYIQLSILYISAFLSKIFDPDWLSGQFMHNWLFKAMENPYYILIYKYHPERWLSILLSWSSIIIELIIGVLLLMKNYRIKAVWIIIIFHASLYTFTATRFGFFMDDIFIILISFLAWPKSQINIHYKGKVTNFINGFWKKIDWDKTFNYIKMSDVENNWLILNKDGEKEKNNKALRSLILYNSSFYFLLFFIISIITFVEMNKFLRYSLTLLILWGGIFFFFPFEKIKKIF